MGSSYLVTILKNDGQKIGLFASSSTKVNNTGGGASTYTALSTGDALSNIVYKGADISSLTINYDADPGLNQSIDGTVKGTIDEFYNDIIYINKSTGGTAKYNLNVNCEYILDGKSVSQKSIADAMEDNRVDVSVSINVKGEAVKLDCTTKESDYIYGELKDISKSGAEIKKSAKTLVMRAIAGVIIFFVPTLLNFIVELLGEDDLYNGTFATCTHCMLEPTDDACRKLVD